jgi:hypothetical protein
MEFHDRVMHILKLKNKNKINLINLLNMVINP